MNGLREQACYNPNGIPLIVQFASESMMPFILSLFNKPAYLIWPVDWLGYFVLVLQLIAVVWGNWKLQALQRDLKEREWFFFGILLTLAPVGALTLGLRVPQWGALPLPSLSLEPTGGALMFFAALPAVLGAWFLGPINASALGFVSGVCLAYWDTHSPYTALEFAILAMLLSAAIRQRYRTILYGVLRRPFLATLLLAGIYALLFFVDAYAWASGSMAETLDFAISNSKTAVAAIGGSFAIAGLITEFAVVALPNAAGLGGKLSPSPAEKSLKIRFLTGVVWLTLALVIVLLGVNWFLAGRSAERLMRTQMENIAQTTTNEIPFFFNTGQSLINQYAEDLSGALEEEKQRYAVLERSFRSIPFFSQLTVFSSDKEPIAVYPSENYPALTISSEIQSGISSALNGVPVQVYVVPAGELGTGSLISFVGSIPGENGQPAGVLMGIAELATNPFTQPVISDLTAIEKLGGAGYLLDEQGRVLYATAGDMVGGFLPGFDFSLQERFSKRIGADGTRQLVYIRSALGRPWTVMLTIPSVEAQQMALDLAVPFSAVVMLCAVAVMGAMYLNLNRVAGTLRNLTEEADRFAKGQLDRPVRLTRKVDDVGRLQRAFEKMRRGLKNRMVELNRLLQVSQGVASSLEMGDAVQTILTSALEFGASSARIVLDTDVLPEGIAGESNLTRIGSGKDAGTYQFLDAQILEITRNRSPVLVANPTRMPLLEIEEEDPLPAAILAVALRQDQLYLGVLWLTYSQAHNFPDREVRFMVTLAEQAALAVSKYRLFYSTEENRKRLAAILASTPDPILVTDHRHRLLLCNPTAEELIHIPGNQGVGTEIQELTDQLELINLVKESPLNGTSREITLGDQRVFLATVSPLMADTEQVGRVCVLRDITELKEIDEMKSDFVSSVSHDLRSPLTLMRGYATMLEMVGELNDQQQNYVHKIITGVESMSHLVQNLLDLGRIEAEVGLKLDMVSAPDIVAEVTEAYELRANQRKVSIHVNPSTQTIPFISADKALLTQALRNLVDNAINFNNPDGTVWVRYRLDEGRIIFEVEDTGIGISPVDQQHLFEKFYRVESREKDKQQGTGLGLAIVRSIAERHGGEAWMESELGRGSIFYLAIPIRQTEKIPARKEAQKS